MERNAVRPELLLVLLVALLLLAVVCVALLLAILRRLKKADPAGLADAVADEVTQRQAPALSAVKTELLAENRASRAESNTMAHMTMTAVSDSLAVSVNQQLRTFTEQNRAGLDAIRGSVQAQLEALRQDNHNQLDRMRETVDEKLQKTLDDRVAASFRLVNERLQEVYAGLGEMRALAGSVGDLKKVLGNVKARGILGEYQLGAILDEILSPEQYEENVATKRDSGQRVEYAIRLPGEGAEPVYLPVDAKFPGDTYAALAEASDAGEPAAVAAARAALAARIKSEAKEIRDKYIDPPYTTDFAILFLPFEGLYAEAVRMGLVEELQRRYRVSLAGPTTFAALLNSLQMGFRTLAVQKRSAEVWNLLGAVKTEFAAFESVLEAARKRIEQTGAELDKLVGARTRKINSRLRNVSALPAEEGRRLIDEDGE